MRLRRLVGLWLLGTDPTAIVGSIGTVMLWLYRIVLGFGYVGAVSHDGSSFAANQDIIMTATAYRINDKVFLDLYHVLATVPRILRLNKILIDSSTYWNKPALPFLFHGGNAPKPPMLASLELL